ncbi:MAG: hypothetical protein H0W50_03975 [Parachlamydiaceae bacterium]|nr:hypothetical protein [Parachlamydiaceae bacterium]
MIKTCARLPKETWEIVADYLKIEELAILGHVNLEFNEITFQPKRYFKLRWFYPIVEKNLVTAIRFFVNKNFTLHTHKNGILFTKNNIIFRDLFTLANQYCRTPYYKRICKVIDKTLYYGYEIIAKQFRLPHFFPRNKVFHLLVQTNLLSLLRKSYNSKIIEEVYKKVQYRKFKEM